MLDNRSNAVTGQEPTWDCYNYQKFNMEMVKKC